MLFLSCLLAAVHAVSEPVKRESNGIVVIYSWGKVCIGLCEWDCAECLEWNEANGTPVENSDTEFEELWLENNDGTSTPFRFPLKGAKSTTKGPKLDIPKHSRPKISYKIKSLESANVTESAFESPEEPDANGYCQETVCINEDCRTRRWKCE